MKKIIILLLLTSTQWILFSQERNQFDIFQNSPDVANLGKFVEYPVNKYTGIPSVNIPIFTIKEGDIEYPISLSYQEPAVKVSDFHGCVGQNWTLNAFGSIGWNHTEEAGYKVTLKPSINYTDLQNYAIDEFYNPNTYDLNPKIYFYNFGKYSGKFIETGDELYLIPKKNLYFSKDNNKRSVTDENGVNYSFNKTEANYERITGEADPYYVGGACFIDKIKTPSNNEINFVYDDFVVKKTDIFVNKRVNLYIYGSSELKLNIPKESLISKNIESYTKRLTVIETKDKSQRIEFKYKELIENNYTSFLLDSVVTYNQGQITKKIVFNYDNSLGRNFLKELTLITNSGKKQSLYKFDYYPGTIPPRNSLDVDYYGYYNGANNTDRIASTFFQAKLIYDGADKFVNPSTLITGALKSIVFPTGGVQTFEYEPNQIPTTSSSLNGLVKIDNNSKCFATPLSGKGTYEYEFNLTNNLEGLNCTIPEHNECKINIEFTKHEINNDNNYNEALVELYNENKRIESWSVENPGCLKKTGSSIYYTKLSGTMSLDEGKYYIKLITKNDNESIIFDINTKKYSLAYPTGINYTGGLRLKSMINNDGIKNEKRFYLYNSSGQIVNNPKYLKEKKIRVPVTTQNCDDNTEYNYIELSSSPTVPIGLTKGSFTGYKHVTEVLGNIGSPTRIDCYYSFEPNKQACPSDGNDTSYEHMNGNLIKQIEYNSKGMVKKTENEYSYSDNDIIMGMRVSNDMNLKFNVINTCYSNNCFSWETFSFFSERKDLAKVITTNYYGTTTKDSLTQITDFTYNQENFKIASQENILDNNYRQTVNYYYPSDFINQFNCNYLNTHNIQVPIKIEKIQNNNVIDGKFFEYNDCGKAKNIYEYTGGSEINSPDFLSKSKQISVTYNTANNLQEKILRGGETTTYLWGYNNRYPIAEIKNSSFSEIKRILSENMINQLENTSNIKLISENISILRDKLKNSMITSYLYDLFGITSITNPNGVTTYYEYDDFGRLNYVLDADKNIISSNSYQYQVQTVTEEERNTSTISSTNSAGGTITAGGSVNYGSSKTFTITPSTGYHITNVKVDGVSKGVIGSYTFSNVTTTHTIHADFVINSYTIHTRAGIGGNISGNSTVNYNGNMTINIIADTSYEISDVLVNGISKGAISSYTFNNVKSDQSITASFKKKMFKLIIMNTTGGSVNPSTSQIVEYGGNVILYFTPNEGYKCKNVYINNVPNPTFNGHLTDIKQDYTIKFEWEKEGGGGGLPGHVIEI